MENDDIPGWCFRGGIRLTRDKPEKWRQNISGDNIGRWNKQLLIPFGRATPEYREKYYLCPECDGSLEPMLKEYRFVCPNCRLIFGWGFGCLYGFGTDSDRAEYAEKI